jgi:hypothetical protein
MDKPLSAKRKREDEDYSGGGRYDQQRSDDRDRGRDQHGACKTKKPTPTYLSQLTSRLWLSFFKNFGSVKNLGF